MEIIDGRITDYNERGEMVIRAHYENITGQSENNERAEKKSICAAGGNNGVHGRNAGICKKTV